MNTKITPDEANIIISEAIDRAAITVGFALAGHSPTHGATRWSNLRDPEVCQSLTEECWQYIISETGVYDSDNETFACDVYIGAHGYLSAAMKS